MLFLKAKDFKFNGIKSNLILFYAMCFVDIFITKFYNILNTKGATMEAL
jgi:hypothetical protein